mgnify:CR=1 FL=1|jgi:teichuronic acid biosynthesis glycosyltransferase TuaG
MLISIIMPNYNGGKYIGSSINSVINQTYRNWELIIVDDCSTDNSAPIIENYSQNDNRIKSIILENNSGTPGVPRNKGLERAKGEFIAFLDSDDIWHPQKLKIQVNFLLKHVADFCFTQVLPFKNDSEYKLRFIKKINPKEITFNTLNHGRLLYKNIIKSGSSVLVKEKTIGTVRFNEDPKYKGIEDYLFWLNLHQSAVSESYQINNYLVAYRLSDTSISRSKLFMFRQNIRLYHNYMINGKPLWLGYQIYYLIMYVILSIFYLIKYKIIKILINRKINKM